MRVVFAGTPGFAAHILAAIVEAGHAVPLVLTQPDRPAGRGQRLSMSPVKTLAAELSLPVYQPLQLRSDEQRAPLLAVATDVMVVAAYGLILPQPVLDHPRYGCLNVHASLLPRWRGAAPIQRAILAGDDETGVCIMQMDKGLDTGPVVSRHPVAIAERDTAGTLLNKLASAGAAAIVEALSALARIGNPPGTPQAADGITHAPKITREEARIDWKRDAAHIVRQVRAFNPAPGAFTEIEGAILKIWSARTAASGAGATIAHPPAVCAPGVFATADDALVVGCAGGELLILDEVQAAGSRRMTGITWARGRPDLPAIGTAT